MFDDYVELDPGAAVELEEALQKRYTPSNQGGTSGYATSGLSSAFSMCSVSKIKTSSDQTQTQNR